MPGVETMLLHEEGRDKPGEGEICFRGRHVMLGYMKDQVKSRATIDSQNWLHSGDVGRFDEDGFVYITGRIKELIITAGGENIAPVPIEQFVLSVLPGVSKIVMIGDRRKYNIALITLLTEPDENGQPTDKLTGEALEISDATTVAQAQNDANWLKHIAQALGHYNSGQNGSPLEKNAAKIHYARVLDRDFSVSGGELGPTLKLKRGVVADKYGSLIESIYSKTDKLIVPAANIEAYLASAEGQKEAAAIEKAINAAGTSEAASSSVTAAAVEEVPDKAEVTEVSESKDNSADQSEQPVSAETD
jgi:long-chain-fatty-acid--CoA ligase ACSBG